MKRLVVLTLIGVLGTTATPAGAQSTGPAIVVAGSPIAADRPAERVAGEWFVPIAAVARAINARIETTPNGLRVTNSSGVQTDYDRRTGEVRFQLLVIGTVRQYRQVVTDGPVENILFPASGLVTLLGVDVYDETDRNLVRIEVVNGLGDGLAAPRFILGAVEYAIGATAGPAGIGHQTSLRSDGVANGVSVASSVLLSGTGSNASVRQGLVQAAFASQRRVGFGDQSSATTVDPLVASFRGAGFSAPVGGFDTIVYGGRAVGSTRASAPGTSPTVAYGARIAGADVRRRLEAGDISFSAQWFDGDDRSGAALGAAYVRFTSRNQLKVQAIAGRFEGLSSRTALSATREANDMALTSDSVSLGVSERVPVAGTGFGISVLDTFTPFSRVSLTAQADRYSPNVLTARDDPQFNAQLSRRFSATFRPVEIVSIFAGLNDRTLLVGTPATLAGSNRGINVKVPRTPVRLGYVASNQRDSSSAIGAIALTQYSATLSALRRYSGSTSYSISEFGGDTTRTISTNVSKDFGSAGILNVAQQLQLGSSRRIAFEWQLDHVLRAGASFRVGVERVSHLDAARVRYVPVGAVTLPVGRDRRMQVSYSGDHASRALSVGLTGALRSRGDVSRDSRGISVVEPAATLTGRVYFDTNNDNKFAAADDRAIGQVTVWLNDEVSVTTDAQGTFRFPSLKPGAYAIRAELDGVPADLVFAEQPERTVAVMPYGTSTHDFRVVRTGSVQARVVVLEPQEGRDSPAPRPLPEARVLATPEIDSYTDIKGLVLFGSLTPGVYDLQLDPESVPAGYAQVGTLVRVEVKAGEVVRGVEIVVGPAPREIIRRNLGRQESTVR